MVFIKEATLNINNHKKSKNLGKKSQGGCLHCILASLGRGGSRTRDPGLLSIT